MHHISGSDHLYAVFGHLDEYLYVGTLKECEEFLRMSGIVPLEDTVAPITDPLVFGSDSAEHARTDRSSGLPHTMHNGIGNGFLDSDGAGSSSLT